MKVQKFTGKGDSLWGESKGIFTVKRAIVNTMDAASVFPEDKNDPIKDRYWGELQLFGDNTEWYHYTDTEIEKGVKSSDVVKEEIVAAFKKEHNIDIKVTSISWSEQGMQPNKGWSFDIVIDEA